jgi:hypothetical protein
MTYTVTALQSPPPSPSSPTDDILVSIGPNTVLNIFAILAQSMYIFAFFGSPTHVVSDYLVVHFPELPKNWTRVMCHAYNDVYSSVGTNLPRVHSQSLVPRAIHEAKAMCIASNPEWAPDEHGDVFVLC